MGVIGDTNLLSGLGPQPQRKGLVLTALASLPSATRSLHRPARTTPPSVTSATWHRPIACQII